MSKIKGNGIVTFILIFLILLSLLSFSAVMIKNFSSDGAAVALSINGTTYKDGESAGYLDSGTEVKVVGVGNYTVTITGYRADEDVDFLYTVGEETYSWKEDVAAKAKDFTEYFDIETTSSAVLSDGFTLSFGSLNDILTAAYGGMEVVGDYPDGDIFQLTISSTTTLSVTFGIASDISGITLSPESYVF